MRSVTLVPTIDSYIRRAEAVMIPRNTVLMFLVNVEWECRHHLVYQMTTMFLNVTRYRKTMSLFFICCIYSSCQESLPLSLECTVTVIIFWAWMSRACFLTSLPPWDGRYSLSSLTGLDHTKMMNHQYCESSLIRPSVSSDMHLSSRRVCWELEQRSQNTNCRKI
jgi:hypothetical protein